LLLFPTVNAVYSIYGFCGFFIPIILIFDTIAPGIIELRVLIWTAVLLLIFLRI